MVRTWELLRLSTRPSRVPPPPTRSRSVWRKRQWTPPSSKAMRPCSSSSRRQQRGRRAGPPPVGRMHRGQAPASTDTPEGPSKSHTSKSTRRFRGFNTCRTASHARNRRHAPHTWLSHDQNRGACNTSIGWHADVLFAMSMRLVSVESRPPLTKPSTELRPVKMPSVQNGVGPVSVAAKAPRLWGVETWTSFSPGHSRLGIATVSTPRRFNRVA